MPRIQDEGGDNYMAFPTVRKVKKVIAQKIPTHKKMRERYAGIVIALRAILKSNKRYNIPYVSNEVIEVLVERYEGMLKFKERDKDD